MQDPVSAAGAPLVTIAMPALNEAAHIADAIASVLPDRDAIACELLVLDGGSRDDTCAIVAALSVRDPRIRLVHNERRIQAAAINLAARLAHPASTYLVRADCHAVYPEGFVQNLVGTIRLREAVSVVVPLRTVGVTPLQRAIAAAQNSRLGNGGSAHRQGGISGYVAHGHHAVFDRREFLRVGGYDETFTHNEDAELDRRLCAAGGRIYLAAELAITYFPRACLGSLARQYLHYGRGCARTLEKHASLPRPRQILPALVLLYAVARIWITSPACAHSAARCDAAGGPDARPAASPAALCRRLRPERPRPGAEGAGARPGDERPGGRDHAPVLGGGVPVLPGLPADAVPGRPAPEAPPARPAAGIRRGARQLTG